jgi:hypothetical protein
VARAFELVLSLVPRNDATQVRAHGIDAKVTNFTPRIDHQVSRVTLQTLRQSVITRQVVLQPSRLLDVVTGGVLGRLAGATTTRGRRDEVVREATQQSGTRETEGTDEQQVHHVTFSHVLWLFSRGRKKSLSSVSFYPVLLSSERTKQGKKDHTEKAQNFFKLESARVGKKKR